MQIDLTCFGDLFGFSAAINIAFVAVDYFHSYSYILSSKVFKFHERVENEIDNLKKTMVDETSINNIEPVIINQSSTLGLIEEAKINRKVLEEKFSQSIQTLKSEINSLCESKTNSFISLFLSMYAITGLLLIGVYSKWGMFIEHFWMIFTLITSIVVVLAWIIRSPEKYIIKLCSLKHCLYLYGSSVFLSLLIGKQMYYNVYLSSDFTDWIYIYSEILSLSNFVVYIFIINHKSNVVKKKICDTLLPLEKECKEFNELIKSLINTSNLSQKIKTDKNGISETYDPRFRYKRNKDSTFRY